MNGSMASPVSKSRIEALTRKASGYPTCGGAFTPSERAATEAQA